MAGLHEGFRTNARGQKLYIVEYLPLGPPKAVLLWHHGLQEHIGRYTKVFNKFAAAGIAVYSGDAHGHGKSEPMNKRLRALVNKFEDLVDDFQGYTNEVLAKPETAAAPAFIGGQSMGGLVVLHTVLRDQQKWKGLLLSSALVDVEWTPMLRAQAKVGNVLAAAMPKARIVKAVRPDQLSQDPAVVKDYVEDPLNLVGNLRARTSNELLKAFRMLQARETEFTVPIYAHHGTIDHVTSAKAVKRLLQQAPSTDCTFKEVPGGYHELLLGPEKDDVTQAMIDWILLRALPESKL